ncbi:MAG TPA: FAD-dependent oxidoreductase [Chryseosolibacter sp.]
MSHKVDYIIVGQGLAGACLALQLLRLEKKILVIDEPARNRASRVAAGLFNPVTGQNSVRTWMADTLFPYLHQFYRDAEAQIGKAFFHPRLLYKPFGSAAEQNDWMGKSADTGYREFVEKITLEPAFGLQLTDPFGGLFLRQAGFINTNIFLDGVRDLITSRGMFWAENFDDEGLALRSDFVEYKDVKASRIIFCQGERTTSNKWFSNAPVRPLKGETLRIKTNWDRDVILNRGVYMVPENVKGEFRVGATYKFNVRTPVITEEGRDELVSKLNAFLNIPFEVLAQDWGIRPTTNDRKPLLGWHRESERLVFFNGLGTKGVTLAPYFSEMLTRWLENSAPINKEVALTRYK